MNVLELTRHACVANGGANRPQAAGGKDPGKDDAGDVEEYQSRLPAVAARNRSAARRHAVREPLSPAAFRLLTASGISTFMPSASEARCACSSRKQQICQPRRAAAASTRSLPVTFDSVTTDICGGARVACEYPICTGSRMRRLIRRCCESQLRVELSTSRPEPCNPVIPVIGTLFGTP